MTGISVPEVWQLTFSSYRALTPVTNVDPRTTIWGGVVSLIARSGTSLRLSPRDLWSRSCCSLRCHNAKMHVRALDPPLLSLNPAVLICATRIVSERTRLHPLQGPWRHGFRISTHWSRRVGGYSNMQESDRIGDRVAAWVIKLILVSSLRRQDLKTTTFVTLFHEGTVATVITKSDQLRGCVKWPKTRVGHSKIIVKQPNFQWSTTQPIDQLVVLIEDHCKTAQFTMIDSGHCNLARIQYIDHW